MAPGILAAGRRAGSKIDTAGLIVMLFAGLNLNAIVLMLSGAGDELQGIKRGIMEMADALVITKADGQNIDRAKLAATEYRRAMHLLPPHPAGWIPQTGTCSSLTGEGMEQVWKIIEDYRLHAATKGWLDENRRQQSVYWMDETISEQVKALFFSDPAIKAAYGRLTEELKNGRITSYKAAKELLQLFKK